MTAKIEQLAAAYEQVADEDWRYADDLSAVVYVKGQRLKAAADFGKIDDGESKGEFIALAHNLMPFLLEAVRIASLAIDIDPYGNTHNAKVRDAAKALLEQLK